jgi:hypothetical protein
MAQDMGLTPSQQMTISKSYQANMAVIYAEILKRGMFSWQQQWNGQSSPTVRPSSTLSSTAFRNNHAEPLKPPAVHVFT